MLPKRRKIRRIVKNAYYQFMAANLDPSVPTPRMDKIIADALLKKYKITKKGGESPLTTKGKNK